ncbi:O-antigen ligase family protein [Leifsonia sp. YIM 134122]|uniref:O-antigen ligase family protein n=1 Tax=Leifsonia stereocauli TaxID=3134136 RepID=A0ABU9W3G8_9MICO
MTTDTSRLPVPLLATLVIFTAFAGQFWRNLLGWWGFGIIAGVVIVLSAVALMMLRPSLGWREVPKSALAFVGLSTLSLAWSFYPGASAIGVGIQLLSSVAAVFLGLCLSLQQLLKALSNAFRWILALSLVFEAWVAVVVGGPVLPFFVHYEGRIPQAFYWSRGLLLDGGPIEGIVANRNLLGFIALLALIVFALQLADRTVRRGWGVAWLVVAGAVLLLTRSATVVLAGALVAVVLAFVLWTRSRDPDRRRTVYAAAAGLVVVVTAGIMTLGGALLGVLGKSGDLTGRADIWAAVTGLAQQRPVFGWGWVGYWIPWVPPFDDLAVRKGVVYLQAHNAWLDVRFQLGILGLVLFAALVVSTVWRSWFLAVDRPRHGLDPVEPFSAHTLLPILLLAALIAQSLAESRILIEGGWLCLIAISLMTKSRGIHAPITVAASVDPRLQQSVPRG